MVFGEGPRSSDNVRVLVLGCCSTISSKTSYSSIEGLPDLGLSSRLISPATPSLTVLGPSTLISLVHDLAFSLFSTGSIKNVFTTDYQRNKIRNKCLWMKIKK